MHHTEITKRTAENTKINDLSHKVIGLCLEIHKHLGSGLLESAYHKCLEYELEKSGLHFQSEVAMPVTYKGFHIDTGFRADIIIENKILLELKSVEKIAEIHKSQTLTYLKMSNLELALLVNFKETLLKNGIHRFINSANSA